MKAADCVEAPPHLVAFHLRAGELFWHSPVVGNQLIDVFGLHGEARRHTQIDQGRFGAAARLIRAHCYVDADASGSAVYEQMRSGAWEYRILRAMLVAPADGAPSR